jgi:hypothetical protein
MLRHRALGILAYGITMFAAIGRCAIGFHYASDLIAGMVLGTVVVLIAHRVPLHEILRNFDYDQPAVTWVAFIALVQFGTFFAASQELLGLIK